MPGGDRTGPLGAGPMTGRKMGICTDGAQSFTGGFGMGCGRGLGRGRRRGVFNGRIQNSPINEVNNSASLTEQLEDLTKEVASLKKKINEGEK